MQRSGIKRDLGGELVLSPQYTEAQTTALQGLAFAFSLVSMIAVVLSFHWFLRMRRSFRHDLIMILIQSDMFKSFWFLVFAIASFLPVTIESSSTFCQVCGFFTGVGIEASDFAVLTIAIHNALYIFRPPTSIGEGGLYPYRGIAFALWLAIPALLAGLAFTNPSGGYQSGATTCALPVRPFWYQLALSWIPRYIIFVVILGIDISIYFYVHRKFGGLKGGAGSSLKRDNLGRRLRRLRRHSKRRSVPPTPRLAYNGLLPESRESSVVLPYTEDHQGLDEIQRRRSNTVDSTQIMRWTRATLPSFPHHSTKAATCPALPLSGGNATTATINNRALDTIVPTPLGVAIPLFRPQPSAQTSWTTYAAQFSPTALTTPSTISFLSFLRLHPYRSQPPSAPLSQLQLVDSQGQQLTGIQLSPLQTRDRIRQQLRFLFIYPLAYLGMWLLPSVAHTLQYDDEYAKNQPFALIVLVTIVMRSQGAINCLIFNLKERPWQHRAQDNGLLGQVLAYLRDIASSARTSGGQGVRGGGGGHGPGISRPAMAAEAQVAYHRRDEERAARASGMGEAGRGERRERSWWDVPEMEGEGDLDVEGDGREGAMEREAERRDGVGVVRLAGEGRGTGGNEHMGG